MGFHQVAVINFQGMVVAFARSDAPATGERQPAALATDMHYNVLSTDVNSPSEDLDWDGWRRLEVTNEVRPAGMQLIDVPAMYNRHDRLANLADAGAPCRAITNQGYIYLLRQTVGGTLLVNRFRLVRQSLPGETQRFEHILAPAWEVRFQRSGKPDVPYDDTDVQSFMGRDGIPFVEPAYELPIAGISDGRFDAVFVPRGDGSLLTCTVTVLRADQVDVYEFPLDAAGRFLLAGKALADGHLAADFSFTLETPQHRQLALSARPALAYYLKLERVRNGADGSFMVKRAGRLLLALRATPPDAPATLATVDLGAAADGTVAWPAKVLTADPVGVAPYALEFNNSSYVGLPDLKVTAGFGFELWLYPRSEAAQQLVVGNADDTTAPHLSIVGDGMLEAGFTDPSGNALTARTDSQAVRRDAWSHVLVDFDPGRPAGSRFTVRVNDNVIHHQETGFGTVPGGHAITHLSAPADGFVGAVDLLAIYDAAGFEDAHKIGEWPLDSVIHTHEPPETPNLKDSAKPGKVFGAYEVPSTSPAASGGSGALSFDERGLSISAGYFENLHTFSEFKSSPALLAGADGLLHCYFQGSDDHFAVMQFDGECARAVFQASWSTAAGAAEGGPVQFVASQAGAFMNGAGITIRDSAEGTPEAFCDLTLTSPSGRQELWRGVPRSLVSFAVTLNGEALQDPSDRRLMTGAATYYDASGTRNAAYVPLTRSINAALVGFATRNVDRLPLASVAATAVSDEQLDLTLVHSVSRWPDTSLTQVWHGVPARVDSLLRVLDGASGTFTYQSSTASNVASYSIGSGAVSFFTHPTVTQMLRIIVRDGTDPGHCNVEVALVVENVGERAASWTDVPRRQDLFAATLEGGEQDYDYAALAAGDYRQVGALLVLTTNGNMAEVRNLTATGGLTADNDLRVYASLFDAFVTAPVTPADKMPATATITANAFQKASALVNGKTQPISGGSELFRTQLAALPSQGSVGLVDNTTDFTDDTAILIRQGINGGWRNRPDQRTLSFGWDGYVEFATDEAQAPGVAALTVQGDLSLELWCRPQRSTEDATMKRNQRLLTFARRQSATEGGEWIRYLAGLRECPSLKTSAKTTIRFGYRAIKGTFYTWFNPIATNGVIAPGTIGSISTIGIINPVVSVSVDDERHIRAEFGLDSKAAPIVSSETVAEHEWYQVALPWSMTWTKQSERYVYTFSVDLYVNGVSVGHATWESPPCDEIVLATMVIGEVNPLPPTRSTLLMRVNEAAFFVRPLTKAEIGHYSEQRIPDNADGLLWKWMLLEGSGNIVRNSAASRPAFNADIRPSGSWEQFGLYSRPTLGHGDNIALLTDDPIIHGWSHLAMVHQAGHALRLEGGDYATCGHDSSTGLGDRFSLEAWVQLDPATISPQAMTILGKGEDYELGITHEGIPRFTVKVKLGETTQTLEVSGKERLTARVPHHLAVTYQPVTTGVETTETSAGKGYEPRYEVHISLYVDGKVVASGMRDPASSTGYIQYSDTVELVRSSADLELGRTGTLTGARYLCGYLSDTRLWNRVLTAGEIADATASRRPPSNCDGLVSWWRFNEPSGLVAFDAQGNNDARLNRGELRVGFQPTSANSFYVNGRAATPTWLDGPASVGGYPEADQFTFGQLAGSRAVGFYGQLDSVRIWDTQLTGEQIAGSMNRELSGAEPHLAGLWTFDNGSGPVVEDATGRGNVGHLTGSPAPAWSVSTAPLGNEADGVVNILGGVPSHLHDVITDAPAVVEYADPQRDAYGALFSVMKRAYASVGEGGAMQMVTGYKVGDLDTTYLGQAQTKPSVIGFIEGAPPIPSENQTMPFWKSGGADLNSYVGATSVTFEEANQTTYVFDVMRGTSDTHALSVKAGLYFGGAYKASVGFGAEFESPTFKFEGHAGVQGGFEFANRADEGVNRASGTGLSMPSCLRPGGTWEAGDKPENWLNPEVGRRFVPANTGMALVKSLTVDVYAAILTTTRSMVATITVPNPDVPEDVNILTFPIDTRYVKNGTLDGKVGLKDDPAYPGGDTSRGSYFKPMEAYALKRRIEREQARLSAYYRQYDAERYASELRGEAAWGGYRQVQSANESYDWTAHLAKRNLVNTYVWTAAGGTYAEQTSTMNVYTESYGALSSRTGKIGAFGDVETAFPVVGAYVDFDYLYSWATEVNVVRSQETSAAFSLSATADPDGFLYAPRIEDDKVTFPDQPAEGKVDGYRYLAFYLAPSTDNFDELFRRVIDRNWYLQSKDAGAVALREATASANGAWRVLYRVTYVSRVPGRYQPVPDEARRPYIEPPANLEYNALLTTLIEQEIQRNTGTLHPSPLEIGTAISAVIGTTTTQGRLADLLPWWPQFLLDADNYRLPAGGILRVLREDLLRYMVSRYAAQEDEAHG